MVVRIRQSFGHASVRRKRPLPSSTFSSPVKYISLLLVVLVSLSRIVDATTPRHHQFNYVIVVDAGSGGSRLFVYELIRGEGDSLVVKAGPGKKAGPGLSTFSETPELASDALRPLFDYAAAVIPAEEHTHTPVFIKSTAGMRLLSLEAQQTVYDAVYEGLVIDTSFPFRLHRRNLGTIDGSSEAYYAVLSTNYLEGRIDAYIRPTGHEAGVLGALDMGGASTQIIFPPNALEPPSRKKHTRLSGGDTAVVAVGDAPAQVTPADFWARSHLSYGVEEVRVKLWRHLIASHKRYCRGGGYSSPHSHSKAFQSSVTEAAHCKGMAGGGIASSTRRVVANPCGHVGHEVHFEDHVLVGSGDAVACTERMKEMLWGLDGQCPSQPPVETVAAEEGEALVPVIGSKPKSCPVDGVVMPNIKGDFMAMSVFFYGLDCVRQLGPYKLDTWPMPSLAELSAAVEEFCGMHWNDLKDATRHAYTSDWSLPHRCVESVYMVTLLRDGYGFPPHARNITFALEAGGMEVEWTLGFTLAEVVNGDAASHVAPLIDTLIEDFDHLTDEIFEELKSESEHLKQAWKKFLESGFSGMALFYGLICVLAYVGVAYYTYVVWKGAVQKKRKRKKMPKSVRLRSPVPSPVRPKR